MSERINGLIQLRHPGQKPTVITAKFQARVLDAMRRDANLKTVRRAGRSGNDRRTAVSRLYRKLGIAVRPDVRQVLGSLSRLPRESNQAVHSKLVDVLTGMPPDDLEGLRVTDLPNIRVLSCAKTCEPLDHCFTDPELDRPSRLSETCRHRIVNLGAPSSRKLLAWVDSSFPGVVRQLRVSAATALTQELEPVAVLGANVVDAWRDWLADLAVAGSVVREEIEMLGFAGPAHPLQVIVVEISRAV